MGDEKIIKDEPFRREEEILLIRSCMKDGMTEKQALRYIDAVRDEVNNNHKS